MTGNHVPACAGLTRALLDALRGAAPQIASVSSRGWASATFTGQRHVYTILVENRTPGLALSRLAEQEFPLPGVTVADVHATRLPGPCAGQATLQIEVLTVDG